MDFIGVALDGHPIYGPRNRRGVELTSSSSALDECHGMYLNTGSSKEASVSIILKILRMLLRIFRSLCLPRHLRLPVRSRLYQRRSRNQLK